VADPISSLCSNDALISGGDEELMSLAPSPAPSPAASEPPSRPEAVKTLVAQFDKPITARPAGPSERSTYNVVERSADGESVRSAVGVYELQNADQSAVTVLEMSSQTGKNYDVQVTGLRSSFSVEHAGYGLSLSGDVAAARMNSGVNNDDGSVGGNIGINAEAAGLEATLATPAASLTLGASISIGASGSSGVRDADAMGSRNIVPKFRSQCLRSAPAWSGSGERANRAR